MTVVSTGMTKQRAQEEAARLNEEQQARADKILRDQEHRNRVLGLTPAIDYLPDWMPDTPVAIAARMKVADAEQQKRAAAIERDRQLQMRPETLRPVTDYLSEIELADGAEEGE
ncbi:hypothetical protein [Herbaspirillum rubrisubalbicans]|nr:hypothetical protein [Herbaspirillum rubrisubalbicans]